MIPFRFRKFEKKLLELRKRYYQLDEILENKISESGCLSCKSYNKGVVQKKAERFIGCSCDKSSEMINLVNEIENVSAQIDMFIEGEYSKAIFEYFVKKQPNIIRVRTKEIVSWNDVFGTDYNNLDKNVRYSLVSLVEGDGKYCLE